MDNYHITKDGDEWKFQKAGAQRAIRRAETKEKIIAYMQGFMESHIGSVKIHKEDGSIQEERTYPRSSDPRRTKG
ncbi:DUF2188 domain-containing protein [Vreelandella venusta]|uniref:DUF2188 domain-containing protein n=1 Tax=Vreelandella venusta TaxID=44935 RepID=UPI003558E246